MNKLIDEFVAKARQLAISDTHDGGKAFDLDLFHAKFAELIVRECIEICLSDDWEDQQGWGKLYAHKIKKTFNKEMI